jgi:Spy/CpxP family protein refolding chaperone
MMKPLTVFIFAAVSAASLLAQRGPGGGPPPGGTQNAATFTQRRIDSLATILSLTDSQKTQALKIYTDAQTANAALQTQISTNRTAIRDAVKKNDIATIDKSSAAIGTLTGQIEDTQGKADAAFYSLLTPDQRTKYDTLHAQGPGMRRMGPWSR